VALSARPQDKFMVVARQRVGKLRLNGDGKNCVLGVYSRGKMMNSTAEF
jgi:hypothetical protein